MQKTILLIIGCFIAGLAAGWWLSPEKVKIQEKIVVKTEVRKAIDTHTRTIKRPDGTVETETTRTDRSEIDTDKTSSKTETPINKNDWLVTALVGVQRDGLTLALDPQTIAAVVQRRMVFDIYSGMWLTMNGDFGLALTMQF